MEKKERKGRRAYLDDFRRTVDGEYIYIGATYAFQGEQSTRKRGLLRWGILAVGMVACAIVGGCIRAPGTVNCAYVLIPYAVGILAAFLCSGDMPVWQRAETRCGPMCMRPRCLTFRCVRSLRLSAAAERSWAN